MAVFAIGVGVERHYLGLPEVTFCLHFGHLPNRLSLLIALCTHCPPLQVIRARNRPLTTAVRPVSTGAVYPAAAAINSPTC